ncbi:NUDIX domain-containing protein [Saxibacter everestensis]|uniref:NUDIX domain-containing protein n=1 Tax=Saxibacter everestensis TaxID=2909229 RepID=A0ABY8QSP8_9MICO|nr:NUDIX domain-containing protein [Brevibacteriaceae bacterium ZFBP1038]
MTTLSIAAACLLTDDGELLTVRKRGTTKFMLPGGKREAGEDALSATLREVEEEVGLSLDAGSLRLLGRFNAAAANEADTRVEATVYSGRLPHQVFAAAEIEELRLVSMDTEFDDEYAPLLREKVLPALRDRELFAR